MPDAAEVCHACGRKIIGKSCPECAELPKAAATKCRYCGHDFARDEKIAVIEPYLYQTTEPIAAWADIRPLIQTLRLAVENHRV